MKENDNDPNIDRLYKQYQKHRDGTPTNALRNILAAAEANSSGHPVDDIENSAKEVNIQSILETAEANVANPSSAASIEQSAQKHTPLIGWLKGLFHPSVSLSSAMACSFVAILALTTVVQLLPSNKHSAELIDTSLLDNCQICGNLAVDSTIKTRGLDPNLNNNASKFGQFAFGLKLINQLNSENQTKQQKSLINAIRNLAKDTENQEIYDAFNNLNSKNQPLISDINTALDLLNTNFLNSADKARYVAGQWLERLRVSSERAIEEQTFSEHEAAFDGLDELLTQLNTGDTVSPTAILRLQELSALAKNVSLSELEKARQTSNTAKEILKLLRQ